MIVNDRDKSFRIYAFLSGNLNQLLAVINLITLIIFIIELYFHFDRKLNSSLFGSRENHEIIRVLTLIACKT